MKSSTASNFSKAKAAKTFTRVVAGLIFTPKNPTDAHYPSLHAWVKAGRPDNAYIFDHADTLKVCGIPICDGAPMRGMYRRIPALKPRKASITLVRHLLRELVLGEVKTKVEGIEVAEVKAHHRMVY